MRKTQSSFCRGFLHGIHSLVLPFKQERFDLGVSVANVPSQLVWCATTLVSLQYILFISFIIKFAFVSGV
jgi:hypothetical protein